MKRWAYAQIMCNMGEEFSAKLNEWGEEGWEYCCHFVILASVHPMAPQQTPPVTKLIVVFKKEK